MPLLLVLLIPLVWTLTTLGVAWPTERLLKALCPAAPGRLRPPWFSFGAGLGYMLLSTAVSLLAMAGALRPWILQALVGGLLAAGCGRLIQICRGRSPNPLAGLGPFGVAALIAAGSLLPFLALPPTAWDALVYHLEVPRQYLLHGGVTELPGNNYAYFPMATEMLYLLGIGVFPPFSAQVVHAGFLVLTFVALGEAARSAGLLPLPRPAVFALVLVAAVFLPSVWLNAAVPYIDVAMMFFAALVVIGLTLFYQTRWTGALILSLLAGGALPAVKYTGYFFLLVLGAAAFTVWSLRRGPHPFRWRYGFLLAGSLALFAGPFLARNFLWTGNPLFPFFAAHFGRGSPAWTADQQQVWLHFLNNYGSWLGTGILYPLNYLVAAFSPTLNNDRLFDGVLGPFLLLWPILWLLRRRLSRPHLFLVVTAGFYALTWGVFLRQMRFLSPVVPLSLLLLAGVFRPLVRRARDTALLAALALLSLGFSAAVIVPELATPRSECKTMVFFSGKFLLGEESQTAYLTRVLPEYRGQEFLNQLRPAPVKVLLLMTGNKNFYLAPPYQAEYVTEDYSFHRWLAAAQTSAELADRLRARGVSHLFMRVGSLFDPALYADDPTLRQKAFLFLVRECRLLHESNGFAVFSLRPPGGQPTIPASVR